MGIGHEVIWDIDSDLHNPVGAFKSWRRSESRKLLSQVLVKEAGSLSGWHCWPQIRCVAPPYAVIVVPHS